MIVIKAEMVSSSMITNLKLFLFVKMMIQLSNFISSSVVFNHLCSPKFRHLKLAVDRFKCANAYISRFYKHWTSLEHGREMLVRCRC